MIKDFLHAQQKNIYPEFFSNNTETFQVYQLSWTVKT